MYESDHFKKETCVTCDIKTKERANLRQIKMNLDYKISADDGNINVFDSHKNPINSSEEASTLGNLCSDFYKFMQQKDGASIKPMLFNLYDYISTFPIVYCPIFNQLSIFPSLLFVVADPDNVFDIDTRKCTIEIIYKLICVDKLFIDQFAQCNAIELFSCKILFDDTLEPLYLTTLSCLEMFAGHCEMCQTLVCKNLPFPFFERCFSEYPVQIPEMNYLNTEESDELADENLEVNDSLIEHPYLIHIFQIMCNIFTLPVDPDILEQCFQFLFSYKNLSSELLKLFFLSFRNIVKNQPRDYWYYIFEQCGLRYTINLYLFDSNLLVRQYALSFIQTILSNKQDFAGLNMHSLVSLIVDQSGVDVHSIEENEEEVSKQLELEIENQQNPIRYDTEVKDLHAESLNKLLDNKLVILYTLKVIHTIIDNDHEFIDRLCSAHFFDVCNDVYDGMTSDIKEMLFLIVDCIARHGNSSNKKELLTKGLLRLYIDMAVYGTECQSCAAIDIMGALFSGKYKKNCYASFRKASNYRDFFELANSTNSEVRDIAIRFLNDFFPKRGDTITILVD